MTWLAASLYGLGAIGAMTAVGRDAHGRDIPAGAREWVVVIGWPIAVGAAIILALTTAVRRSVRP